MGTTTVWVSIFSMRISRTVVFLQLVLSQGTTGPVVVPTQPPAIPSLAQPPPIVVRPTLPPVVQQPNQPNVPNVVPNSAPRSTFIVISNTRTSITVPTTNSDVPSSQSSSSGNIGTTLALVLLGVGIAVAAICIFMFKLYISRQVKDRKHQEQHVSKGIEDAFGTRIMVDHLSLNRQFATQQGDSETSPSVSSINGRKSVISDQALIRTATLHSNRVESTPCVDVAAAQMVDSCMYGPSKLPSTTSKVTVADYMAKKGVQWQPNRYNTHLYDQEPNSNETQYYYYSQNYPYKSTLSHDQGLNVDDELSEHNTDSSNLESPRQEFFPLIRK